MNKILAEDFEKILASDIVSLDALTKASVFITGATGLVGSYLVQFLHFANKALHLDCRILAGVRDLQKAHARFHSMCDNTLSFVEWDTENDAHRLPNADYIIHAAAPTASKFFVEHPIETISSNVLGCRNILRLAQTSGSKGVVFLSTMEVYGTISGCDSITEDCHGSINPTSVRSCYPESKRLCETLCAAYASQCNVPAKIVRLTQCLGPGASQEDARAAIQFAASVFNGRNIELHTAGTTARCYCYLADAATGILAVLLKGKSGEAYNVASAESYCTISDMANRLILRHPESKTKLIRGSSRKSASMGYAAESHLNLSVEKIKSIGWRPLYTLDEAFDRLLLYWADDKQ